MSDYLRVYNRQGERIDLDQYLELVAGEQGNANRRVRATTIEPWLVSTVWLGFDHGYSMRDDHKPVIFETMVFLTERPDDERYRGLEFGTDRYCTEEEAILGHETMCLLIQSQLDLAGLPVPERVEVND